MIFPKHIQAGDRIRIVSPAGKVDLKKLMPGVELLKEEGFEVILSEHVAGNHFQFSGTEEERLNDLQLALDDDQCQAIICARGGYGSIRIMDQLDLTALKTVPKWLVGFSDVTNLHCLFQKEGIASIHGAMPGFYLKADQPNESFRQLIQMLKGELLTTQTEASPLNREGNCRGQLTGGNLSIIYSLLGTPYEIDTAGKILFIEDLSEYLYHLDRMMHSLKLAGKFEQLAGFVVGQFSDMKDNDSPFGQSVEEIILNAVKDYNFPVCFNFPAGHVDRNLPLICGRTYELEVDSKGSLIMS